MEASEKGKSIGETSNPLTIEKPAEPMPKIPKGVFNKSLHNPNARPAARVFFKDCNNILKYSILGDFFGLKKTCL